ncbi:MAG: zinc-ribbon domain-containing protein [Lactimicrobium sp.]|jgi:hypothetical protein|uniref:zinc-ribbon domain-containing protein n=1 Tax=Lactimicrobium sp. TaxID=2563780 RepID=UPI002F35C5B5
MLKYTEKAETPLKWHRFNQAVLMPLIILGGIYLTICTICVRLGRSTDWMFNTDALLAPQDDKWLYYISFAFVIVETLIVLQAWLRSFRWIRSSWWYQMTHYLTLALYACYAFSEIYRHQLAMVIGMNLHLYLDVSLSSRWVFLILAVLLVLTVMYCALSLVYYGERHRLYRRMVVEKVTVKQTQSNPAAVNHADTAQNQTKCDRDNEHTEKDKEKEKEKDKTGSTKAPKSKRSLFSLKHHEKKTKQDTIKEEESEPAPEPIAVPSPLTKEQKEQLEHAETTPVPPETEKAEPVSAETAEPDQKAAVPQETETAQSVESTAPETSPESAEDTSTRSPQAEENTDSKKTSPQVRFCSHCGAKLKVPGAKFCPVCGQPIQPIKKETMADHD